MAKTANYPQAQNPLILRANRLMEAFAKSDDERDFYVDKVEGFILYMDLDKPKENLAQLEKELENQDRYCLVPKLSFYETKKIMESFVNEKVYDIDTKEKLLDIIQGKEARENFLEFIYDQHTELEKWQQFYQERSRIRIIEWLRNNNFHFVFEEDLDLGSKVVEKLKEALFDPKAGKDIQQARKTLFSKAKTYYSNEALNPRPKRGRPPKQIAKQELEPQVSADIYTTVPATIRQFLFTPDITQMSFASFSSKFKSEEDLLASRGHSANSASLSHLGDLNKKLDALRSLSKKWMEHEKVQDSSPSLPTLPKDDSLSRYPLPEAPQKKGLNGEKKPLRVKDDEEVREKKAPAETKSAPREEKKPLKKKAEPVKADKPQEKKRIIPRGAVEDNKKRIRKIIPSHTKKLEAKGKKLIAAESGSQRKIIKKK